MFHHRHFDCYKTGIQWKKYINDVQKELLRKSIHMCTAVIPFMLREAYVPVMKALLVILVLYCVAELLRLRVFTVPFVSAITEAASRKRDENHFVLGPATLAVGVLVTAAFFEPRPAAAGIFALAFGDGLASLVGKCFGRIQIPCSAGKTAAGSIACWVAVFCSSMAVSHRADAAFGLALTGMLIEVFPIKDFDNIFIPVLIATVAQFYFHI